MSQNCESGKPMLRALVDGAELREAARDGVKRPIARATLARQWGVSFWTLTNFRRGRLKDLRGDMRDRIKAGIVRGIETEIQRLEHELSLVRQSGADLCEVRVVQAAVALDEARKFLKGN